MQYALVTGGSRGIGRAICRQLAKDGFYVLINYRSNHAEAEESLQDILKEGGKAELMPFDVADKDAIRESLNKWKKEHEGEHIEVLVNNAGISRDNLMVFMKDEEWSDVLRTNLDSFFFVTKELLQDMIVKKRGSIINVVSLSGMKGQPGQVNYSAAKAAVVGATKALAQEIGKKKVRVNAVAPGFISTDMTKELPEKELKKMIPLARFGKPEEVAYMVSFLASEKAAYITGETIQINGGLYT